jgi:hypothetical protein
MMPPSAAALIRIALENEPIELADDNRAARLLRRLMAGR